MRNEYLIRRLFCRKGYGVHSPFVFDLITHVIEERCAYYYYRELETVRQQLLRNEQPIYCRGAQTTVRQALRKHGVSRKEGELLFRLANRYQFRTILTAGSSMGLIPLSLTGYASGLRCITVESDAAVAAVAQAVCLPALLLTGSCRECFAEALETLQRIDFLFIGKEADAGLQSELFLQSLPYLHDETVCLIGGIRSSSANYRLWRRLCVHPQVTVTVDLHALGLVFFSPRLHQRTYKSFI